MSAHTITDSGHDIPAAIQVAPATGEGTIWDKDFDVQVRGVLTHQRLPNRVCRTSRAGRSD
jgi:hypothetical protein